MDDQSFTQFLQEQRLALADIDLVLYAWQNRESGSELAASHPLVVDKTLQTRFDSAVRSLADAYVSCTPAQRDAIRDFLRTMVGVREAMGIRYTEIRHRIDAVRFRLALIYESMKDLGHDTRVAVMTLDNLVVAARIAGINLDPAVKEVAALSSACERHDMGSMRDLLLAHLTDRSAGNRSVSAPLPAAARQAAVIDIPFTEVPGHDPVDESPIILLTHKLLGFYFLSFATLGLVVLAIFQTVRTLVTDGYHGTATAWIIYGVMLLLVGVLRFFRFAAMVKKYSTLDGRLRIEETRWQYFFLILLGSVCVLVIGLLVVVWMIDSR